MGFKRGILFGVFGLFNKTWGIGCKTNKKKQKVVLKLCQKYLGGQAHEKGFDLFSENGHY